MAPRPVGETGRLTDRARRVLRALQRMDKQSIDASHGIPGNEHVSADGWHLAYDIAQEAQVDNRSAGPILRSLERRGLVGLRERGRAYDVQAEGDRVRRSPVRKEKVWRITDAGQKRLRDTAT